MSFLLIQDIYTHWKPHLHFILTNSRKHVIIAIVQVKKADLNIKMRRLYLNDRFKLFLASKPPLVTFLLCLMSFIFVMISFRIYIDYTENISNPDEVDWNVFSKHLSKLDFCIMMPMNEAKSQKPASDQQIVLEKLDKEDDASL